MYHLTPGLLDVFLHDLAPFFLAGEGCGNNGAQGRTGFEIAQGHGIQLLITVQVPHLGDEFGGRDPRGSQRPEPFSYDGHRDNGAGNDGGHHPAAQFDDF